MDINSLKKIGSGAQGFAKIFFKDGIEYVVKTFDKYDEDSKNDFTNEVEILKLFQSDYIISFIDVIETETDLGIVLPWAKYGSLMDFIKNKFKNQEYHNFEWKNRYKISADICKGIEDLHKKNIIHRDIKSENILIFNNYNTKICDLAFAKNINNNNSDEDEIRGSLQWKSPESFNNEFTFKSDIYSFGIILWEILTGEIPYINIDLENIQSLILNNDIRPEIKVDSPSIFISIIKKCWNKDPSNRPDLNFLYKLLINLKIFEEGNSKGSYNIGVIYYLGEGFDKNIYESFNWFLKSAEQGNINAQLNIGIMYFLGIGIEKNISKSFNWFFKSAEQGNSNAQYQIGGMYYLGIGIEKNINESFNWLLKSAEQNNLNAQYKIGIMYYFGKGTNQDLDKSFDYLIKFAEFGNSDAQNLIGMITYLKKNEESNFHWFLKSAEKGNLNAQFNMGLMYYSGIQKDHLKSFFWFLQSAKQGHPKAQFNIGIMYYKGEGVKKDFSQAYEWIRKSLDQGYLPAKNVIDEILFAKNKLE